MFTVCGKGSLDGDLDVLLQGLVFHFTISTGTSEAEATNFYIDMGGRKFLAIWRDWCHYARRCAEVRSRTS